MSELQTRIEEIAAEIVAVAKASLVEPVSGPRTDQIPAKVLGFLDTRKPEELDVTSPRGSVGFHQQFRMYVGADWKLAFPNAVSIIDAKLWLYVEKQDDRTPPEPMDPVAFLTVPSFVVGGMALASGDRGIGAVSDQTWLPGDVGVWKSFSGVQLAAMVQGWVRKEFEDFGVEIYEPEEDTGGSNKAYWVSATGPNAPFWEITSTWVSSSKELPPIGVPVERLGSGGNSIYVHSDPIPPYSQESYPAYVAETLSRAKVDRFFLSTDNPTDVKTLGPYAQALHERGIEVVLGCGGNNVFSKASPGEEPTNTPEDAFNLGVAIATAWKLRTWLRKCWVDAELNDSWKHANATKADPKFVAPRLRRLSDGLKSVDPTWEVCLNQLGAGGPEPESMPLFYYQQLKEADPAIWTYNRGAGFGQQEVPDRFDHPAKWYQSLAQLVRVRTWLDGESRVMGYDIPLFLETLAQTGPEDTEPVSNLILQSKTILTDNARMMVSGVHQNDVYQLHDVTRERYRLGPDFQNLVAGGPKFYPAYNSLKCVHETFNSRRYGRFPMAVSSSVPGVLRYAFRNIEGSKAVVVYWRPVPMRDSWDPGVKTTLGFSDYGWKSFRVIDPGRARNTVEADLSGLSLEVEAFDYPNYLELSR